MQGEALGEVPGGGAAARGSIPCRRIEVRPSTTCRTPRSPRARAASGLDAVSTSPGSSAGSGGHPGIHGVSTSTSPPNPPARTSATSCGSPTATVAAPRRVRLGAEQRPARGRTRCPWRPGRAGLPARRAVAHGVLPRAPARAVDVQRERHAVLSGACRRPTYQRKPRYSRGLIGKSHSPRYSTASPPVPSLNWISPNRWSSGSRVSEMPRRSYTDAPAAWASQIIRHWMALLGRTSRLTSAEAP